MPRVSRLSRSDSTAAASKRKYERGGSGPHVLDEKRSSGQCARLVVGLELLHVDVALDEQRLLGDAHVAADVLGDAVAHGTPREPPAVLREVVEQRAERAEVVVVEREVVEVRRPGVDERHLVVLGVAVEPGAGVAEPVGDLHAQHVAVERRRGRQVAREAVDVPELARPQTAAASSSGARSPGAGRRRARNGTSWCSKPSGSRTTSRSPRSSPVGAARCARWARASSSVTLAAAATRSARTRAPRRRRRGRARGEYGS